MSVSRRDVLFGGGALCVGVALGLGCGGARDRRIRRAEKTGELAANLFITVLASGRVRLTVDKAEIGQGVVTGYATLVAEELEVSLDDIDHVFADSLPQYRRSFDGMPMFKIQMTGGSTSIKDGWIPVRRAAAAAREMLVGAAARRWGVPARGCRAEAGQVIHDQSGRRLGYGELTVEAARLEVPESPRLKPPDRFKVIGRRVTRSDVESKVRGAAIFGIDVAVEGKVCAAVIHGPVYGARPASIRADAARSMPGVIDVFGFRWGVAVVAEKFWQARAAAARVDVEWGRGAAEGLDTRQLAAAARRYTGRGNVVRDDGDAGRGEPTLRAIYEVPHLAHAPLEPQNCTAKVSGDRVEIWAPCQVPTIVQEAVGEALDVDPDDVLVHTTYAGGGFGRRILGDYAVQAALIARRVGRPVQMIWSRESDMAQGYYRPAATAVLEGRVAPGSNGAIEALWCHSISQPITPHHVDSFRGGQPRWVPRLARDIAARSIAGAVSANTGADLFATEGAADTPYRIPNLRIEYTPVKTGMPISYWRSVGHSFNGFFIEGFIDELAHAAGIDPYQLRRRMLPPGSRERRVLDAVARASDWSSPARPGFAKGIARHTSFHTEVAEVGIVDGRIRVSRVWCAVDCGIAVNPDVVAAQMEGAIIFGLSAALDQAITMTGGVVEQSNYDDYPALRMFESPEISVEILASEAAPTGVGEPGLPPIAPAVANAIFAATGVRLREMPLQPALDRVRGGR